MSPTNLNSFIPVDFIEYADAQPGGRYNVTKDSKEEVRLVVALCPDIRKQLVMLQDLILIGGSSTENSTEKKLVNLAAEIFMIMPNDRHRETFYHFMSTQAKILEIFAKAVKENVAIHSELEEKSEIGLLSEDFDNEKKINLVMYKKDVAFMTKEQLSREKAYDIMLSERFQSSLSAKKSGVD